VEEIKSDELNKYMRKFILNVKRKDEQDFKPSSLRGFFSSFSRFLKKTNTPKALSMTKSFTKQGNVWKLEENNLKNKVNETNQTWLRR